MSNRSNNRYTPSPKSADPNTGKASEDTNALWRIPQWFSDLEATTSENLRRYHAELLKFNSKVNLISRNTERDADEVHFADCILAGKVLMGAGMPPRVYDMGSGNGLPGLVLAIMDPTREYVLVESDVRKCEFMKHVAHTLDLKKVVVANVRLETLSPDEVHCAVSRGLASISKTILGCNRLFKKGGIFIHLKGNSWAGEVAEIPSQLISVWKPQLIGDYSLPVSQAQRAVVATLKIS